MPPLLKYEWEEWDKKPVLPLYNFSEALALPVAERFEGAVAILQEQEKQEAALFGEPSTSFGPGFAASEIADLERVQGSAFAPEVREFLRRWNRVEGISGLGFYGPQCWVEAELAASEPWLMIGDYWRYADGDQLVMPLFGQTDKVFLYLHEHGPKIEEFAPSFSLALWRMAHE